MPVTLILSIIDKLLAIALIAIEKATPEQVQAVFERHEKRIAFFENLLPKDQKSEPQDTKVSRG